MDRTDNKIVKNNSNLYLDKAFGLLHKADSAFMD